MKLLKINSYYPTYLHQFYSKNKGLKDKPFNEQKNVIFNDAFSWGNAWTYYLNSLGYITDEIIINAKYMQQKWASERIEKENKKLSLDDIAVMQAKNFKPEILWYDSTNEALLEKLKDKVSSIKLVIGWVGSAIANSNVWKMVDIILTCAPESVEIMKKMGINIFHVNHAFDSRVLLNLKETKKQLDLIFIGQLIRKNEFHTIREKMLENLADNIDLKIFSPAKEEHNFNNLTRIFIRREMSLIVNSMKKIGIDEKIINKIPKLNNVLKWDTVPVFPDAISKKLLSHLRDGVYGLAMFQTIKDSKITLNIHADTSPKYASNMRLFETTGVGSLLLTEKKSNLRTLFEPDKEIVTYNSAEECVEKAKWLLENNDVRTKIAKAGQNRTLKEHSFEQRIKDVDAIIRKGLKMVKK